MLQTPPDPGKDMPYRYPLARVAVFNDTSATSHYGCEFVMQTIEEQLRLRNILPVFSWPMGKDWRTGQHVEEEFARLDAVIVNGEGSIHHSDTRERAHYLTETARFFRERYGIPSFLINATLHEIGDDIIDNIGHFRGTWVRESSSHSLLADRGIRAKLAPDLTFMVDAPMMPPRIYPALVTDSVIRETGRQLKELSRRNGWHFTKLTHSAFPLPQDRFGGRERLRRYAKWLLGLVMLRNRRNRYEFLYYLSSHNLLCSGRFHAVTLALATATPYLALDSNTPKISSLTRDVFGTTERVISPHELGSLSDPRAFAWSGREQEALSHFLRTARSRIVAMFDEIRESIDSSGGRA